MRRARQPGFALIEAIVAITILAAAMVPIYSLMSTTIFSAYRVAEVNQGAEAEYSALEVLRAVNPMQQPEGSMSAGLYTVSWHAISTGKPLDGVGYPRGFSLYQLSLFDTEVWARDSAGKELAHFNLRLMGYQRVRDIQIPFTTPRS